MMHVMQPVVLDNGWPTTHAAPTNSSSAACLSDDVTLVSRAAVTASLSSSAVNGADMVDSQSQNITRASFNTLNQVDMCSVQPLAERTTDTSTTAVANQPMMKTSANTPKPPKKPLTPYMRFSQAVWPEAKQVNPNFSVCELGSIIGRRWRELSDADKQPYFDSFTNAKVEYDKEIKTYLDANGLKPSDLTKPKVRKKDVKKQHSQVCGDIQQHTTDSQQRYQQLWSTSAPATIPTSETYHGTSRPAMGQPDDLLVYHVRPDGTPECYVQRGVGGMKVAAAAADGGQRTEREMLLSTLAEQTRNVTQLRLQLLNARGRVVELEQQNDLLRQLVRDAQPPTR